MDNSQVSRDEVARKTKQSLLWYTSVPFLIHFLRFANSIILARLLSPADFGIIGIVTVILYYCDSFSDFGFGKAIIQRDKITRNHFASYFSFNITISLLFFISAQVFSDHISIFFETPEMADAIEVFAFFFLITAFTAGPQVKLKRELNFKSLAIIEAIKVITSMATSLSLALNGYGFWSIIYAMLLAQLVTLILLIYVSKLMPTFSFNFRYLKDLFHFGLWDFIGAQIQLIGESADKVVIGKILGVSTLGFYDKALGLARMPNDQISTRVSHISFSSFSRIQNDNAELENYFFKIIILNAAILLPIFAGLIWVSKSFTVVLLGEKWLPMVPCLQILAVSFVFRSFTNPIVAMNHAKAKVKSQTIIRFAFTLILVFGLLLATPYGIDSAALVIMGFNILMFFSSYLLLNSYADFGWMKLVFNILPPTVIVACMCLSLYILDLYFKTAHEWQSLILSILVGGITYAISFLILPFKNLAFLRKRVMSRLPVGG